MESEYIETRPQPKYALLDFGGYYKLNHALSVARGWTLENNTERYAPMNPPLAKVNVNEETFDVKLVLPVLSEIQENHADLLAGTELHNSYEAVEGQVSEIIATGLSSEMIDWTLMHYLRVGITMVGVTLWLEDEARTALSDEAVQMLNELGVTIVTIEP